MRSGFLLSPRREPQPAASSTPTVAASPPAATSPSEVVQAVEAEDCPVCLDPLEPDDSLLLSCRHLVCTACAKAVWSVGQADAERRAKKLLECPVCRTTHEVARGDLSAFVAAHLASNFGDTSSLESSPSRPPATRKSEGLATLTVAELRLVASELGLDMRGAVERSDIERIIEQQLERKVQRDLPVGSVPPPTLALLPLKCLRCLLESRCIPYDDCPDRESLVKRVEQSPKGSCLELPVRVLKRMLVSFGLGDEKHVDKAELARATMAGRVVYQTKKGQRPKPSSQQQHQQPPRQSPQPPQPSRQWHVPQWQQQVPQAQWQWQWHNQQHQHQHQQHQHQHQQHQHQQHLHTPPRQHQQAHFASGQQLPPGTFQAWASPASPPAVARVSPYPNGTLQDEEEHASTKCCSCSIM